MWLPDLLSILFTALGLVSVACLVWIVAQWQKIGALVSDLWPKVVVEAVQLCAAGVSIGGAFAVASDKPDWLRPAVASAGCLAGWKVVQILVDNRAKSVDRIQKRELERAIREGTLRTRLLSVLRAAVNQKVKRLRKQLRRRRAKPSIRQVREALTPEPHLNDLLESLAVFFLAQLPESEAPSRNFRVGVYLDRDGIMTPVHAVSLKDPGHNPFTSYESHVGRFRLAPENTQPANVVVCVRQKGMVIVGDCEEAAREGEFHFFDDAQPSYLRSMAAYFLGEVCDERGTMKPGALVVDTDVTGFFQENDRDSLEFCFREFGARLKLEILLHPLIAEREARR
jgi:hypothetical protein